MIDIDKAEKDPMLVEFTERRSEGSASPLDRANAALLRADQAASIFTGGADDQALTVRQGEGTCSGVQGLLDRVALATAACGLAERKGEPAVADAFAKVAEREAVTLDSYDSARLEGLNRASAFSA
jgi:hypothetical protein